MAKKRSLSQILLIHSAALLLLMVACLGYFWVYREYNRFQDEIQAIQTQFIESQKELIQTEVQEVIDYVRYMRSRTGERARAAIRERVYEAHNLASHLYGLYHGRLPDPEIKRLIVEALRPVRFNNGRGYYFATSLDGVEQLFADRPELENTNILDMRDTNGKYVVRDMIAIARTKGEGFYEYTWTKPGQAGGGFAKIAFVKYFKPFDLFIGTGEYVDDMEGDLRKETLERIAKITFGNDGYIFVQDMNGVFLTHPQKEMIGRSHRDFTEPYDVKIGQELLKAARYPNGG
ncbi:MAG: cache domain-containing protein, partial [Deltaproteobacteria bacterium]|nr:cache domain-containing protein [Deltaproteobacteria bacterium]